MEGVGCGSIDVGGVGSEFRGEGVAGMEFGCAHAGWRDCGVGLWCGLLKGEEGIGTGAFERRVWSGGVDCGMFCFRK